MKMDSLRRVERRLFADHPSRVAPELLGRYLVVRLNNKEVISKIVETEAYGGREDRASHVGRFGLTGRSLSLWGRIGYSYVYAVHINTYCLNVVAHKENEGGSVFIRALEPVYGVEEILKSLNKPLGYDMRKLLNGPGKLCRALNIDKAFNGKDMVKGREIFITQGEKVSKEDVLATPRINIPYAGNCKDWPWRFIIKNS